MRVPTPVAFWGHIVCIAECVLPRADNAGDKLGGIAPHVSTSPQTHKNHKLACIRALFWKRRLCGADNMIKLQAGAEGNVEHHEPAAEDRLVVTSGEGVAIAIW